MLDTPLAPYALNDRYTLTQGRVYMTGTQALVRILLDQARRDRAAGLNTAGFVSGYRGSPLGAVDTELWRARELLDAAAIRFLPAVNEDLGATAVLGSQQAVLDPGCTVDGVFGLWYGKGPGVDRSGDALRHGNAYGSAPKGGVLVVAGDDHGCVSSSMPHQSDVAFMAWMMPTLHPASIDEYLAFGEYGYALSRYSGAWVGFKAISETVESARSVTLNPDRVFALPPFDAPPGGLHVRRADLPSPEIETRLMHKRRAIETFADANPIDRTLFGLDQARFGIVSSGKAFLDTREALRLLGLTDDRCRALGIDLYKVGMVWPLARRDALAFVRGKTEVLVIEEKRGIIESQFKEYFYDWPGDKPQRMVGKTDETGAPLVPWTGELSPRLLAPIIAARLDPFFPGESLPQRARALTQTPPPRLTVPGAVRKPYFCSGCPHNTSTRLPQGSRAASGIGCHVMASWMDRETEGYAQMGGEGVPWVARSLFNGGGHLFQNLGEGTWYHSGSLAIRQAVAAGANITYKILFNDAVAMTGGQPVDGPITVAGIAQACRAEGVEHIAIVSDTIDAFARAEFPSRTTFDDRAQMDAVQRRLRNVAGVSVLIYAQTCATEKRRQRKRGKMADPARFAAINPLVCEGCGDCSVASNCLSVEPRDTVLGRKRQINLSTCNKDFTCLDGFCPSFVTVEGGTRRAPDLPDLSVDTVAADLPHPVLPALERPYDLMVTGVGGTGVITVGALVAMAAHLEGKGVSVLDFTGFAQKFGTVISYLRLGTAPEAITQGRIERADAVIGCDIVVSSAAQASVAYHAGTRMVLNTAEMPTADFVLDRDADQRVDTRIAAIKGVVGALDTLNANALAEQLLGDQVYANVILLGAAWQRGLVPVSLAALDQAIALNGTAIARNRLALAIGRRIAVDPAAFEAPPAPAPQGFAALVAHRAEFLTGYQNAAYAARYRRTLGAFRAALPDAPEALAETAARALFKLMAYKDEYEVARLATDPGFARELGDRFQGGRIVHHMAPPFLPLGRDARGRPRKIALGPWIRPVLRGLARLKPLRGTAFDPFGYSTERRRMRALIGWYEGLLDRCARDWTPETADLWQQVLDAPNQMRGFGPVWEQAVTQQEARVAPLLARLETRGAAA